MYGRVTYLSAYAGQYADSVKGESLSLKSFAYPTVIASSVVPYGINEIMGLNGHPPIVLGLIPADFNEANDIFPTRGGSGAAITGVNGGDTNTVTLTNAYQWAESKELPGLSNSGSFTRAVNDVGSKLTGVPGGTINELTAASASGVFPFTGTVTSITQKGAKSITSVTPAQSSAAVNTRDESLILQSMGYEYDTYNTMWGDSDLTYATEYSQENPSSYYTYYDAAFQAGGYNSPGGLLTVQPYTQSPYPYSITTGTGNGAKGKTFF